MASQALTALLAEAKLAYHQLRTGTAPRVVVDQNGARVEYAAANAQGLYSYIQELEARCGCAPARVAGPAQFIF